MDRRSAMLAKAARKTSSSIAEGRASTAAGLILATDVPASVHRRGRICGDDRGQSGVSGEVRKHHAPGPGLWRIANTRGAAPAGAVTDQIRANMKCAPACGWRHRTTRRELLGRPDATFLPNKAGRGYLQVGSDLLQPIQVAWAGAPYNDERTVVLRDVIWLDGDSLPDASAAADAPSLGARNLRSAGDAAGRDAEQRARLDRRHGRRAAPERDGVPVQTKPWPDPLPEHLSLTDPLDARYLNTDRSLGSRAHRLSSTRSLMPGSTTPPTRTCGRLSIGRSRRPCRWTSAWWTTPIVPSSACLTIDLSTDPLVIFGAAGRGKTTFVKTLLTALAVTRSPNELHIYALDFGRGGLKSMKALPHLGASIDASETARVEQMIRMLRNFINERQDRLSKYRLAGRSQCEEPEGHHCPRSVVVIDNFAEFKESFEHLDPGVDGPRPRRAGLRRLLRHHRQHAQRPRRQACTTS